MHKIGKAMILENHQVAKDIYLLKISLEAKIKAGQFFMLKLKDSFMQLYRPISVYDFDEKSVSFLYSIRGKGTLEISKRKKGSYIDYHGPIGNGFPEAKGRLLLLAGGIGMAPLYNSAKNSKNSKFIIGLRENLYTANDLDNIKSCFKGIDLSFEIGGYVTDKVDVSNYDTIFTCGPEIMMQKISKLHKNVYVSLERHMGCGFGVCLSCTVKRNKAKNSKDYFSVCLDGPVFHSSEVF